MIGTRGSGVGPLQYPYMMALQIPSRADDPTLLYVADTNNNRVQVFNAVTGQYVRMLGTGVAGSAVGQLNFFFFFLRYRI
jgi:DNA-binding beta-propeller fold protein YncE